MKQFFLKVLRKRVFLLLVIVVMGGLFMYNLVFVSDIPITQANVNYKSPDSLELKKGILFNYWEDTLHVEAGRLAVKENRTSQRSNNIEIYFERLKTSNPNPLAPIFFLAGGPGSSGTRIGRTKYFYLFKALREYSDVILIDQRGTGNSIPNLACRNFLSLPTDSIQNIEEAILEDIKKKCEECAEEFRDMGIDLVSYTSAASASDIEELRERLGYNKITLYGVSYGTELAQFYIKHFSKNVEKAILAGPLAPDQGVKLPEEVQAQFQKMDSLIKLDKRLSKYIPDFLQLTRDVHQKLKETPQFVSVPLEDALDDDANVFQKALIGVISTIRPSWEMTLTDAHLQMIVSDYIGNDRWISRYPGFYYQISTGNYNDIGNRLRNLSRRRMPNALFFTVNGTTGYTDERWRTALSQEQHTALSNFGISYGRYPEISEAIGVEKQTGMNDPVSGDTEMLLIGGTLDGRTPVSNLDTIARRFPNHKKIIIENGGHNELIDNQIMEAMISFVKDSLKSNLTIHRKVAFSNPVSYKYAISDTLAFKIEENGIEEALGFYEKLYEAHGDTADYVFDFREHILNSLAYRLMNDDKITAAITVLEFAIKRFPDSYNLYNSLGEIQLHNGDMLKAKRNFEKALQLNYFDVNSHNMLNNLARKQ